MNWLGCFAVVLATFFAAKTTGTRRKIDESGPIERAILRTKKARTGPKPAW